MDVRTHFPALDRQVYGKPLIYFDNAATAQRPDTVLALQQRLCVEANGNIHRAVHKLSADATDFYSDSFSTGMANSARSFPKSTAFPLGVIFK